jgi:hypothetical protein
VTTALTVELRPGHVIRARHSRRFQTVIKVEPATHPVPEGILRVEVEPGVGLPSAYLAAPGDEWEVVGEPPSYPSATHPVTVQHDDQHTGGPAVYLVVYGDVVAEIHPTDVGELVRQLTDAAVKAMS